MPRKKTATATAVQPPVESRPAEPISEPVAAATAQRVKRLAKAAASQQETKPVESPPAKRFRSWVTDRATGYERFVDEKEKLIVLKFRNKPSMDILDLINNAGFRYHTEYFGHAKVWTQRNDFAGREQVKAIEAALRGPTPERA
jgi:hypothetical protein